MRPDDTAATHLPDAGADRPLLDHGATRLAHELVRCRGRCRRQELTIDGLTRTLTALRRGVMALKAENAELRAEIQVLHKPQATARYVDVTVAVGPEAPAAARAALTRALTGHVTQKILADAQLVVSELVTNSVLHAGVPAGAALQVSAHMADGALLRANGREPRASRARQDRARQPHAARDLGARAPSVAKPRLH